MPTRYGALDAPALSGIENYPRPKVSAISASARPKHRHPPPDQSPLLDSPMLNPNGSRTALI